MKDPRLASALIAELIAGALIAWLVFTGEAAAQGLGDTGIYSQGQRLGLRPPPGSSRSIIAVSAGNPPVIDGNLEDEAWLLTVPSGDFWMTDQERWPDEKTEVMVTADSEFLYVAFRAYDSQPGAITAIETVRDRGLGFDDHVMVEIDTYGDLSEVSKFRVNARGTQDDTIADGRATNISWKGDWFAAVARDKEGWTAEFAIPFRILNYRTTDSQFAINFTRYHHRTRQWSRWADVTPQDKKEEMGRLVDLELPGRGGTQNWTIMPFVLAGQNVLDRDGDQKDYMVTGGMDIRYTPGPSFTGLLSLNPDFSQVETQITDANFSYNEKSVEDPRVFFREGSAYLGEDERVFYSPRVPDFEGGAKTFGQSGNTRYAAFATSAPDDRVDGLARIAYAFDSTHSANLAFVGTDREDLTGTTLAFAAEGREQIGTFWDLNLISTQNDLDPEDQDDPSGTDSGVMYDIEGGWQGDYFRVGVEYDRYQKDFSPENGLIKTDRLGTDNRGVYAGFYRSFGKQLISEASFDVTRSLRQTDDGDDQNDLWFTGGSLEWVEFLRTSVSYYQADYRPTSGDEPGQFSDEVNDDHFWTLGLDFNTRSSRLGYGGSLSSGDLGGGDYEYLVGYLWARPTATTSVSVTAERLDSFGIFKQFIVEGGWDVTTNSSLLFRHIDSDGDAYWRLGYRRVVREGLDIFALYDDEPFTDAQVSLKLVWTL